MSSHDPGPSGPVLSIVIITRNEEKTIAACLEAVVRECAEMRTEIILVDSSSTDATVRIALQHPITVLQLEGRGKLSPSAGRYVGTRQCHAPLILFLDGDMVLIEGWLRGAMKEFADPGLGGLAGRVYWVFPGEVQGFSHEDAAPLGIVRGLGGGALFRAEALRTAGTFNPFLKGEEERELGYRIASAGYALKRTDNPMAFHFNKEKTLSEIDEKASHFVGVGQILRRHPLSAVAREVMRTQWLELLLESTLLCGAAVLCVLAVRGAYLVLAVCLAVLALLFLFLVVLRGVRKNLLFFRTRVLTFYNLMKGVMLGIPPADTYDAHITVLKK
jgi:glycosyltransferase involved in cell wall biosynthesis